MPIKIPVICNDQPEANKYLQRTTNNGDSTISGTTANTTVAHPAWMPALSSARSGIQKRPQTTAQETQASFARFSIRGVLGVGTSKFNELWWWPEQCQF